MSGNFTQQDCWDVIDCYFKKYNLVSQQLASYDKFTDLMLDIVREEGKFTIQPKNQYHLG